MSRDLQEAIHTKGIKKSESEEGRASVRERILPFPFDDLEHEQHFLAHLV